MERLTLTGIAGAIIKNITAIAGINDPQLKITPVGFLKMLVENNALVQVVNEDDLQKGQARDIKVRYMQRGLESEVSDRDDCDTPITPEWKESTIGAPLYSKIGIMCVDKELFQNLQMNFWIAHNTFLTDSFAPGFKLRLN